MIMMMMVGAQATRAGKTAKTLLTWTQASEWNDALRGHVVTGCVSHAEAHERQLLKHHLHSPPTTPDTLSY